MIAVQLHSRNARLLATTVTAPAAHLHVLPDLCMMYMHDASLLMLGQSVIRPAIYSNGRTMWSGVQCVLMSEPQGGGWIGCAASLGLAASKTGSRCAVSSCGLSKLSRALASIVHELNHSCRCCQWPRLVCSCVVLRCASCSATYSVGC